MKTRKVKNYGCPTFEEFQKMGDMKGTHKGFVIQEAVTRNTKGEIFVQRETQVFPYREEPFSIKLMRSKEDPTNFEVDAGRSFILPMTKRHQKNQDDWVKTLSSGIIFLTRENVYHGWDIVDLIMELPKVINDGNHKKFHKMYQEAKKRIAELHESIYVDVFLVYCSTLTFKETEPLKEPSKKILLEKMPDYFNAVSVTSSLDTHMDEIRQTKDDEIIKKAQELLGRDQHKHKVGFKNQS